MGRAVHTVAVTGATGFIGGALVRALVSDGYVVRALVRATSRTKRLPPAVERIVGTLDDPRSLVRLLDGADALVHCAGAVRGATAETFMRANADAVERLAELAAEQQCLSRFLLMSSLAASAPQVSPYAASKYAGEQALARRDPDVPWLALRPPAVYGPGDRELLPLFKAMARGIAPVWSGSEARFSLIYIDDLVSAIMRFLDSVSPASGVYELHDGRDNGYCMDEVIDIASAVLQRRVRPIRVAPGLLDVIAAANMRAARVLRYAPMLTPWKLKELRHPRWVCDNTEITAALGWSPATALVDGLPLALAG